MVYYKKMRDNLLKKIRRCLQQIETNTSLNTLWTRPWIKGIYPKIRDDCVLGPQILGHLIDHGRDAHVYAIKYIDRVVRIAKIEYSTSLSSFHRYIYSLSILRQLAMADDCKYYDFLMMLPCVYDVFTCTCDGRSYGVMVMGRYDGNLRDYMGSSYKINYDALETILTNMFTQLHGFGFAHRDVVMENIMYKRKCDGSVQFVLTDFGDAVNVDYLGDDMRVFDAYLNNEKDSLQTLLTECRQYYDI